MIPKRARGFTLLEVLIATTIMAFIGIATASTIRRILKDKETVDRESESLQEARAILAVIERDVSAAYLEQYEDLEWNPTPKAEDPSAPPPPIGKKPLPVTIFQGKSSEIFLSARSHQRMSENTPENEFHFVTYQVTGDRLIRAESQRATSLKDRETPDNYKAFTLLDKITSFKLSYWDKKNERWQEEWSTDRAETRDVLPKAIKIELEYNPEKRHEDDKTEPRIISTVIPLIDAGIKVRKK